MKNYKLIMPLFLFGTVALTSCQVTRDPNKEFMQKANGYYKNLREKLHIPEGEDYKAWYFDPTSLKGALFDNEKSSKYLGIINVQNMTFSEVEKTHFIDIPNYDVKVDMENMNFELPPELDMSDPVNFIKNFPLVLIKNDKTFELDDVYNKMDVSDSGEVTLSSSARADNYNPNLFFIKGFKYDIKNDDKVVHSLDYSNNALAILKRDVIALLDEQMNGSIDENTPTEIKNENGQSSPLPFDIIKGFLKSYKKANKLPKDTTLRINPILNVPGYFGKTETGDPLPVAVGPLSFESLFKEKTVMDVQRVILNEGVEAIGFNAFDSTTIKDVVLPSTIKKIDFSAFSNISTLNSVYIPDTDEPIETFLSNGTENKFEISQGEGKNPIKIAIRESFAGSRINKVIFENYDNKSINNINMNGFNKGGKTDVECLEFVTTDGQKSYTSLKEGFDNTNTINSAFQFVSKDNELLKIDTKGLDVIEKDKTLYLAHKKGNGFGRLFKNLNEYHETKYVDGENLIPSEPTATLTLDKDLTLKGNIIVGGVTGRDLIKGETYYKEGGVVGEYAAIDLNGHKLTVDGGFLDVNGKIIDSGATKGSIEVKNNGVFKSNLVIHDSFNYTNYVNKFNNSDFPYHYYDFEDCEASFKIDNTSRFYVKETLTKDKPLIDVHTFLFAGKNPLIETKPSVSTLADETTLPDTNPVEPEKPLSDFEYQKELVDKVVAPFIEFDDSNKTSLTVKKNEKTTFELAGNIKINHLDLAYRPLNGGEEAINKMFTPLTSKFLDINVLENAVVDVKTKAKLQNNSTLTVLNNGTLNLHDDFLVYEESTNSVKDIMLPKFDEKAANLIVNGKLDAPEDKKIYFGGHIVRKETNNKSDLIQTVNNKFDIGCNVPEGGMKENSYKVGTYYKSNIYIDDFKTPENKNVYTRENKNYYFEYSDTQTDIKNIDTTTIIYKKNNENWKFTPSGSSEEIDTGINTPKFNSFTRSEQVGSTPKDVTYYLNESNGTIDKIVSDYSSETHSYDLKNGLFAIKYGENQELIQGKFIDSENKLFQATSGLQEKYYFKGEWKNVQLFENNKIICYLKADQKVGVNYDETKYSEIDFVKNGAIKTYKLDKFDYNQKSHIITTNDTGTDVKNIVVKGGNVVEVVDHNKDRLIYKNDATQDLYFYGHGISKVGVPDNINDYGFYKIDQSVNKYETKNGYIKAIGGYEFAFTTNNSWQVGQLYKNDNYKDFVFFQIFDEKDATKNFALLDTYKAKSSDDNETFEVFTKAGQIVINRNELEDNIKDLMPEDGGDYVGYRYIVLNGNKMAFIQHKDKQPTSDTEPRVTELVKIDNDIIFKNKEDVKRQDELLNVTDALSLASFSGVRNKVKTDYFMDFKQVITLGTGGAEELKSGSYLALVVYTDKNIFETLGFGGGQLPGDIPGGLPGGGDIPGGLPGGGDIPIPGI